MAKLKEQIEVAKSAVGLFRSPDYPVRIGRSTLVGMLVLAVLTDLTQLALNFFVIGVFVNWIITIFMLLVFFTWFAMRGVSLFSGKNSTQKMIMTVFLPMVDLIPIVGSLVWVIFTLRHASLSRYEDLEKYQVERARQKEEAARQARMKKEQEAKAQQEYADYLHQQRMAKVVEAQHRFGNNGTASDVVPPRGNFGRFNNPYFGKVA